ncbi:MAG: REP-associated tyrosine transposase [Spirochaetaceae bacterium]
MRKTRKLQRGAAYHVVARANRQEFILSTDTVKQLFLKALLGAKKRYRFEVITLCVMSNHVHLMLRPGRDESLSRIMQWLLSVFAIRFNNLFGIHGHVWYDRFKSKVIESLRQFVATFRYILENPVRAGIVEKPTDYRYGDYGFARDGPPGLIDRAAAALNMSLPTNVDRHRLVRAIELTGVT